MTYLVTFAIFIVVIVMVVAFAGPLAVVIHYRKQGAEGGDNFSKEWFWAWIGKGLPAPILICLLLCLGSMPAMPPPTGGIAPLRDAGSWGDRRPAQNRLVA